MRGSHVRILTILGVVAISFVFIIQIFWIRQAFSITESQFEHTVTAALRQVAEKIAVKNKSTFLVKNPVIKVNPRLYIVQVNSEIDAELLDHSIIETFNYFKIDQDVEYSIYSCEDNTMVYCNYIQKKKPQQKVTIELLPKFEGLDYYFSVSFPHYPLISMNNIPMWMITSIVLILVILFFVYALFVVFYQKTVTQTQKDFINNMTHEFKTPISTISIIQQVLSEPDIHLNPGRISTYATIIGDEINRLNILVEKVLHITSIEKKEFALQLKEIHVHEILHQVIKTLTQVDFNKKITFSQHLHATNDLIRADEVHLTNILYNIIENAIKYSTKEVTINVTTETLKKYLLVSIEDKGKGIPKKDIKKIFTKFYRVSQGNTHDVKGFGLGLYYVKQIIDAHKWKIKVESEEGKGTKFIIILPNT
jgi:two-component system phosphate regulon sensor histidine kinase PhoR